MVRIDIAHGGHVAEAIADGADRFPAVAGADAAHDRPLVGGGERLRRFCSLVKK